jgi:hypothetical protein
VPAPPAPDPTHAAHDPATGSGDREPGSATQRPRRKLIFGPEPWQQLAERTWSHWDLWYCTVVVTGFDGDWARLGEEIVRRSPRYLVGRDWEAKLSHLEDLRARLAAAELDAVALAAESAHDKKVVARARRKVLDQPLQGGRDLTPAMRATPRERLWCRAMRGHWDRFPVSPVAAHEEFAEALTRRRDRGRGAWGITQALQRRLHDHDGRVRDDPARRLALWRGLLSAGIEALGEVRDSDGELAGFLGESLATYARLPWQPSGIDAQVYFTDLCELCVWENHGLLYQRETAPFASVGVEHRDLVEALLWSLAAELQGHRLGYPAEVAMALVAYLQAATGRLDRLVVTAERLGSEQWMPIVALAQTALAAGRCDLALEVFAAVNRPGLQQDYLAARCLELTGQPPPRRHLRAVQ